MNDPYWSDDMVTLHLGDCLDVLASMPEDSIDAVVTDPPYDLTAGKKGGSGVASVNLDSPYGRARIGTGNGGGFMGQGWDSTGVAFDPATWREVLRALKPGGHLLAFGGTRTWHRLACAVEDAGFEIRDSIHWIYGSGFPKSLNVSRAIDLASGAEPVIAQQGKPVKRMIPGADQNRTGSWIKDNGREFVPVVTEPATDDAARWEGWGTALKPSHEPIIVARKPLAGTVVVNVLRFGTGAINIDACRVEHTSEADRAESAAKNRHADFGSGPMQNEIYGVFSRDRDNYDATAGRWPPNILLTHSASCEPLEARECAPECPVAELDRQSGVTKSSGGANGGKLGVRVYSQFANDSLGANAGGIGDVGGASRFFPVFRYEAKAGADERPRGDDGTAHPTVKPVDLMRWLVRLVTPPAVSVTVCSECGQELRGVRPAVHAEAARADHLQPSLPSEASRPGAEGTSGPVPDVRHAARRWPGAEVLQRGMPGGSPAEAEDLRDLCSDIPGTPTHAGDVFAPVRREGHDTAAATVRDVRRDVSASVEAHPVLFQGVLGEGNRAGEAQGQDADCSGLLHAVPARSPDGEQEGLPARTSEGDGGHAGPNATADRGRASQERRQGRQPSGEPGSAAQAGARPNPEATAEAHRVPPLPQDDRRLGACPSCGGALVAAERPGLVLDCFAGSGTTAEACIIEGFRSVLIEKDPAYCELIRTRLRKPIQPDLFGGAA